MKNWWSEHICNHHAYQRRIATEPFKYLATLYGELDSVFDVGCGSAVWYENHKAFMKKGDYKGTDVTEEFITASKQDYPETQWEVQDACELKEKDNSWDVVLLIHVLEHTDGFEKPIKEALRVAKKRVIIVLWKDLILGGGIDIRKEPGDLLAYSNAYGLEVFEDFIKTLNCKITIKNELIMDGTHYNYFYVLDKI